MLYATDSLSSGLGDAVAWLKPLGLLARWGAAHGFTAGRSRICEKEGPRAKSRVSTPCSSAFRRESSN